MISFQLVFSPYQLAFARDVKGSKTSDTSSSDDGGISWASVLDGFVSGSQVLTNALTSYYSATGNKYQAYKAQFNNTLRLTPADASQIPAAFNGCLVLPAAGNSLSAGAKCTDQTGDVIASGYAAAIIEVAGENLSDVNNYLTEGHERYTSQGVGCYKQKQQDLDNLLDKREKALNVYKQNLKDLLDNFNLQHKGLLESVKTKTALLNGGNENKDLIGDYSFENNLLGSNDTNNACGSILASGILQEQGEKGGLRGIADYLYQTKNEPSEGSMSSSEVLTKQKQIVSEVNQLAYSLSSRMENSGALTTSVDNIAFRGSILSKDNEALNEVLTNFNIETENSIKMINDQTGASKAVSGDSTLSTLYSSVADGSLSIDELTTNLESYERNQKNSCLESAFKSTPLGDPATFAKSFSKPTVSSELAKEADNALATQILGILNRSDLTIEKKLTEIEKLQNDDGNSAYVMSLGTTVSIGGTKIYSDTPMKPADLVDVFVGICNNNFSASNPNNPSGYSQAQAISKLQSYATQREQIQKTASKDLYSEVRSQLISCPSDTTTGVADNSCTNALSTSSANFCVKTAVKCAKNMNSCWNKALGQVNTMIASQKADVKSYNSQVNILKVSLKKQIKSMTNYLQNSSTALDEQLDLSSDSRFNMPEIDFEISADYFLDDNSGIDSSLKVLDPAAYIEKVSSDIDNMITSLQEQRSGINTALDEKIALYKSNYSSQIDHWQSMIDDCQNALNSYNQQVAKQQEKTNEDNAFISETCSRLQAFGANPTEGETDELANDLGKIVQLQSGSPIGQAFANADKIGIDEVRSFNSTCGTESEDGNEFTLTQTSANRLTRSEFCNSDMENGAIGTWGLETAGDLKDLCNRVKNYEESNENSCEDDTEFDDQVARILNGKTYCLVGDETRYTLQDECKNNEKELELKSTIDRSKMYKYVSSDFKNQTLCNPKKNFAEPKYQEAKDTIYRALSAYNCNEDRKEAGNIAISVCNATLANSLLNGKGSLNSMATEWGTALGSSGVIK